MSEASKLPRTMRPSGVSAASRVSGTAPTPSPSKPSKFSPTKPSNASSAPLLFEASGPGVELALPNKPTSFVVRSTNRKLLKASEIRVAIKGPTTVRHTVTDRPDGTLEVAYTPPMSGEYRITLSVGPSAVAGSPFRVPCQLPRACETCSELDLNGGYAYVGEVFTARLMCKDQYANPWVGRVEVLANVMDGAQVLCEAQVTEVCPGQFDISFYPEISATYGLAVLLDGSRALQGSPFKIRVKADETIPSKCKVYGSQLVQGTAGQPMTFHVQAMDAKNNARLAGGDAFAVEVVGPEDPRPRAVIKDNGNGTYDVTWSTERAGVYLIRATLDGSVVGAGPVNCTVAAAALHGGNCTCTGAGVKRAHAGEAAEFKITAVDRYGNTRGTGGDMFQVQIHSAGSNGKGAPQTALVEDQGDGTYRARYTINVAGQYEVHVRCADTGEAVKGSPFLVGVEAGHIAPRCSRLYGPGLQAVQLGRASTLLVEMADSWGNKVFASGGFDPCIIHIDVRGPGPVAVSPGPLQEGVQSYQYCAKAAGTYSISATVDGQVLQPQHVGGSPATVTASTSEVCPPMCEVVGAPLNLRMAAGVPVDIFIAAKDAKGNHKSVGGDVFCVSWTHAAGGGATNGKVEDLGTGEYRCRLVATQAGQYTIAVTCQGQHVAGSPVLGVEVAPGDVHPGSCWAAGPGMQQATAGLEASFVIKPRDVYGNTVAIDDLQHVAVAAQGPGPLDVVLQLQGDGHSEVMATYTPTVAGLYNVAALCKGQQIKGSSWELEVRPGKGRALHSKVVQLPGSWTAGVAAQVVVDVRDVYGNVSAGGDCVAVEVDNALEGCTALTVVAGGRGNPTATYQPARSGMVTVRTTVNGEALGDAVTLPVYPSAAASLHLWQPGPWNCVAGTPLLLLVQARDEFGNALTRGGADVAASVQSVDGSVDWAASVADLGDGTYAVSCTVTQAGPVRASVMLRGRPGVDAVVVGACVAGDVCPSRCIVGHANTTIAAGEEGVLCITRHDRYGNRIGVSDNAPLPCVEACADLDVRVLEGQDGSVNIAYTATTAGSYLLHCTDSSGEAYPGSPFMLTVGAAEVLPETCEAQLVGVRVVAGGEVHVAVRFKDRYGNQVDHAAQLPLEIWAQGPEHVAFDAHGCACPTQAGSYWVHVALGGTAIAGWPQPLQVLADASDHTRCQLCRLPAGGACLVGQEAALLLQARDAFGNARTVGGDDVQVTAAKGAAVVQGRVKDNGNGTYRLLLVLPSPGPWEVCPTLAGRPCAVAVLQAEHGPLAAKDVALVPPARHKNDSGMPAVLCGETETLSFMPLVAGRCITGDEHVTAVITGPSGMAMQLPVRPLDGGLAVEAAWREAGTNTLAVYVDGAHVGGSPLVVEAQPGRLVPAACMVTDIRVVSGTLTLTVCARDALHNACALDTAAHDVVLVATPATCLAASTVHRIDAHSLQLTAAVQGQGRFNVTVNGHALLPVDRVLAVGTDSLSAAPVLRILHGKVVEAVAGKPCSVGLKVDNIHHGVGGRSVVPSAVLTTEECAEHAAVTDRGGGWFEVSFTATAAGRHTLSVTLPDHPNTTVNAAVHVVPGTASPPHTDMAFLDSPIAGAPCRVALRRRDAHGNALAAPCPALTLRATGPGPVVVDVSDTRDGDPVTTVATLQARTAGPYSLELVVAATGQAVARVPLAVAAAAPSAEASTCAVEGFDGTAAQAVVAGQELRVVLQLRDRFGNAALAMVDAVRGAVHGPQGAVVALQAVASGDGAVTLTATPTKAGRYRLQVELRGADTTWQALHLDELRSTVNVTPAALSNPHTALSAVPSTLVAGAPVLLYIQPTDRFGNGGAPGGAFAVQLYDGKEAIQCAVTRGLAADAPLVAKVVSRRTGAFKLRVIVAKDNVKELVHAADVCVQEGPTAAARSFLMGHWPPSGPVAGIPAGFVIQACDEHGNSATKGGSRFLVDIAGMPAHAIAVTDRGDGSYAVQYTVPSEGNYRVNVTLDGSHVQGSPTSLTAFRDVMGLANSELERKMATAVTLLRRGVAEARANHRLLKAEATALEQFVPVMVEGARRGIYEALQQQDALLAETRAAYQREAAERRRLHNVVQELRGNIRVYVRVKPLSQDERQAGVQAVLRCTDDSRISVAGQGAPRMFDFDRTFGPETSQEVVFEDVAQLVTSALDGFNVCIFAYGQTGAGKTFTMEGTPTNPGINYRTMAELFRSIQEEHTADEVHSISASIVEIYNEVVHDLLAEEGKVERDLHRTSHGFDVVGLTEREVTSPEQIFEIMACGFQHRATRCHDINAHSSRSHCLLIINVRAENRATGIVTRGKLTLCDLAGSERINKTHATGLTLTEAQNINRSLLELGNVISALMQQAAHVPYRNSKLTMLLQDSLGGDSKALMFCNVSPANVHATESLSSLAFASKVANVVLRTPQKNFEDAGPQGAAAALAAAAAKSRQGGAGQGEPHRRQGSNIPLPQQ